jgi:tetratricopeptide (TPR) repeat protein
MIRHLALCLLLTAPVIARGLDPKPKDWPAQGSLGFQVEEPGLARTYGDSAHAERANKYIERGDHFMSVYQSRLAAESYKMALMCDPDNQEAWEKHRAALDRVKAIDRYLDKAESLRKESRFEEAQMAARSALRLDPKNTEAWRIYENLVERDPAVVAINSERDAWDAYREAKALYEAGHVDAALKYLDEVYKFTGDPHLKFYAKSYIQKVQLKIKEQYPGSAITVTER